MGMAQMIFDAVNGFEAPRALIDVAIEPPNLEIMLVNQVEFHFSTVHGAERTFRHIANPPLFMQWMIHRSVLQQSLMDWILYCVRWGYWWYQVLMWII